VVRVSVRARVFVFEEKTCFLFFFVLRYEVLDDDDGRLHFVFCSSRKEQKKTLLMTLLFYCLSLALRLSSKSSELFT